MVDDFDAMRRRVKIRRVIKELLRAGVLLGLGIVFMPLLAQVLGLGMYGDILQALREPQFDAWLLVLTPYFIVTIIRLQRSIRKYLEGQQEEGGEEEGGEEEVITPLKRSQAGKKFNMALGALLFLVLMSLITYIFYPKPTYKNFYGDVNYCSCFGFEKRFNPNKAIWGPNNEEWGICLGVLYNCQQ